MFLNIGTTVILHSHVKSQKITGMQIAPIVARIILGIIKRTCLCNKLFQHVSKLPGLLQVYDESPGIKSLATTCVYFLPPSPHLQVKSHLNF